MWTRGTALHTAGVPLCCCDAVLVFVVLVVFHQGRDLCTDISSATRAQSKSTAVRKVLHIIFSMNLKIMTKFIDENGYLNNASALLNDDKIQLKTMSPSQHE